MLLLLFSLNNSFFLFLLGLLSADDDLKGVEQFGVTEMEISEDLRFRLDILSGLGDGFDEACIWRSWFPDGSFGRLEDLRKNDLLNLGSCIGDRLVGEKLAFIRVY